MDVAQTASFIQSITYEAGILEYEDFPRTSEPAWILGNKYSTLYDMDQIKEDILSRFWFTYRKGFSPIGGTGPSSDSGWGCMLRCGQMMLAQALVMLHLGSEWRWDPQKIDIVYEEILRRFLDQKNSPYSIHQIASMGVSEGKAVGQWFGPNTVAHVLRKLALYDEWSNIAIHVAMDNTVIIEDIKHTCKIDCDKEDRPHSSSSTDKTQTNRRTGSLNGLNSSTQTWKPLLLVIPLRLGLSELNPTYLDSIKMCLSMKQSVGMVGGKPNAAHYFIGYVDDSLVYLDPHTTQQHIDPKGKRKFDDQSFHCPYACWMKISSIDPSVAMGFFCKSEEEFDELCAKIYENIVQLNKSPMFEIYKERPSHWLPFKVSSCSASSSEKSTGDRTYDTDEEYELL